MTMSVVYGFRSSQFFLSRSIGESKAQTFSWIW